MDLEGDAPQNASRKHPKMHQESAQLYRLVDYLEFFIAKQMDLEGDAPQNTSTKCRTLPSGGLFGVLHSRAH